MAFVTDLIWRSPLGLRINAQATADALMTEDWVKLRGDQLAPRDGAYDLRDHRGVVGDALLRSRVAAGRRSSRRHRGLRRRALRGAAAEAAGRSRPGRVQPFASVRDDRGERRLDAGRARPTPAISISPAAAPTRASRASTSSRSSCRTRRRAAGPLWLVAQGWIHPTDSSINVAIAQGSHGGAAGLSLQVADATGRFREVRQRARLSRRQGQDDLIDLTGLFGAKPGRARLRLATNLEIFWDRLGWAVGRPDVPSRPRRLELATADLSLSRLLGDGAADAERARASALHARGHRAALARPRGLLHAVRRRAELLRQVDDRYVIMNAGDELRAAFPASAAAGRQASCATSSSIGDGWVKDGDYNTTFSRTVLPLPTHRTGRYDDAAAAARRRSRLPAAITATSRSTIRGT